MEEQQPIGFGRLLVVALCAVFIAACDQHPAIVNYTQVGACELGPHRAWVFFEIGEINNTKTNTDFKFTPLGIKLEQGMDPSVPWPGYNAIMTKWFEDKKAVTGVTVPKGTAKVLDQFIVFDRWTSDPDGWKEANQTPYIFSYTNYDGAPPVFMSKTNAAQTSWPETRDCNQIARPDQSCTKCHQSPPLKSRAAVPQTQQGARVRR